MVQQHSQHHHASTADSAPAGQGPGDDAAGGRSQPPAVATLGELRAGGHVYRGVKEEIRQNLLAMMRAGQDPFPGIVGFGQTVLPHLERALIAGHDIILLGERGQGKTRLIRTLAGLLDEWGGSEFLRGSRITFSVLDLTSSVRQETGVFVCSIFKESRENKGDE